MWSTPNWEKCSEPHSFPPTSHLDDLQGYATLDLMGFFLLQDPRPKHLENPMAMVIEEEPC